MVKGNLSAFKVTGIDILFNNTAIVDFLPFETTSPEIFAKSFEASGGEGKQVGGWSGEAVW